MALTLLEASKVNPGTVVRDAIIEMFAGSTDLMLAMQWMTINGGSYAYTQDGSLPGVGFRGFNEGYTESIGVLNPQVEVLRLMGGDLDFDKKLVKYHGAEARSIFERQKVTAMGLYLTKKLIKGDSAADPKEFDGLQNRIVGSQLINAGSTNGGDPLSLLKLDEAIDAVDEPTHLVMNKAMRRILTAAARDINVGGYISYGVDALGRKVTKYNDLPILITDYDETGARYLDFNEVGSGGSTATATSIYVLSIGDGKVMGLQDGSPEVEDLGQIDAKPVLRTRIDWGCTFATMHGRCASRLRGISDAPAVD